MKAKLKEIFNIFLGVILIIALLYAIYRVASGGLNAFLSLSDNVQIALSVAVISLFSTLGSIAYTKIKDRKLQIEASHTARKQALYDKFMKDIIELLSDPEKENAFTDKSRRAFMSKAILWSDQEVLNSYHKFRVNVQTDGRDEQAIWDITTLFLNFRKDLGLSNKNLDQQKLAEILYDRGSLEDFYKLYQK